MNKTIYWHYLTGDFLKSIHVPPRNELCILTQKITSLFNYQG